MEPAIKICSTCRSTALLYADVCSECGRRFPVQPFPEENPASEAPDKSERNTIKAHQQLGIALLGALLSIVGAFMPLISIGSNSVQTPVNIATGYWPLGLVVVVIGCAALRKFLPSAFLGSAALTYLLARLIPWWRYIHAQRETGGYSLHLQYGWIVLIAAAVSMILSGAYTLIYLPSDPEERTRVERERRRFLLVCCVGMGAGVLLLITTHTRRPVRRFPPRQRSAAASISAKRFL